MRKLLWLIILTVETLFASGMENSLPAFFFGNGGQVDSEIRFIVNTPELRASFAKDSVTFQIHGKTAALRFAGASAKVALEGMGMTAATVNLLLGADPEHWKVAMPTYERIVYRGLYSGIDLSYVAAGTRIKSEFRVAPHADPGEIRMEYPGADTVTVDATGDLVVACAGAELRERAPDIFQGSARGRIRVEGRYRLIDAHTAGFTLGDYDASQPLIIDPVVSYATYLGGSGMGAVNGVAVDASSNLYVTGWTEALDFPIHGALQASSGGGTDVFVAKLSANGSSLIYATYIGGMSADSAAAIAVDALGNAYVTGYTTSSNFPLVAPIGNTLRGGRDAFVFKLNGSGSQLIYSTYFGGGGWDQGTSIAVDAGGNAYVAGDTQSADLPVLGAAQSSFGGQTDAFVSKFTTAGALSSSTFLGGSGQEHAGAVAVDSSGNIYVGGGTSSTNFPLASATQGVNGGGQDAFLTKLKTGGSSFAFSTYLGGSGTGFLPEQINAVAVDAAGNAYVAGVTNSTDFPVTSGAFRSIANGMQDAFAAKFSASGALSYSTYLGGTTSNWASGIAVDSGGNSYIAGNTTSVDFPVSSPVQPAFGGNYDAFILELNATGTALNFSTYYGGSGSDSANAIAVDGAGNIYAAGATASSDFPLQSALEPVNRGSAIGFVVSLAPVLAAPATPSPAAGAANISTSPTLSWVQSGATSFDVYFGTSTPPLYAATTSGSSYNPGTLIAGQTYYWMVVAKSGALTATSSTWNFTVQSASCSFTIAPQSATAIAAGGAASAGVTTSGGCAWTASSTAPWLSITGANSGTGPGVVNYSAAANTGSARSGTLTIAGITFTVSQGASSGALLTIAVSHSGSLAAGQQIAAYLITVSNRTGALPTAGAVMVTEVPPQGLTIASMSGPGWSCAGSVCARNDVLSAGSSYSPVAVTANIIAGAVSPLINTATVIGGGAQLATGSDAAVLITGMQFYSVTPCRVVDTRTTQNKGAIFGPPSLTPYASRSFPVLSSPCGIPGNAQAYSLNVTVVPSGPLDFLSIWPSDQAYPGVSTMNSSDGSTLANAAIVPAGGDSGGSIRVVAGKPTDVIIDIDGYFAPPGSGSTFYPVTQCRAVDTRASGGKTGLLGPPSLTSYGGRNFPIASSPCGVPATAQAFSLNFTVVPSGTLGFLSTWATGQTYPGVSTLNSTNGNMLSNAALVPSGTGGSVEVVAGNPTDMMIDVDGYFSSPVGGGLRFYPLTPCRLADTRNGQGKTGAFGPPSLASNSNRDFPLLSAGCNIPSNAQAYALNVTVVPPGTLRALMLWPTGQANPGLSTMTSASGGVMASASLMAAGTGGSITVNASNPTDLILDIFGYFAP